jgi:hypothetical protein
MRIEIKNTKFPDLYKFILYEGSGVVKNLIKARSSELSDPDFIETDFRYKQGKLEFGSPDILNELENSDKEVIGGEGMASIEKYLSTLFPSIDSSTTRSVNNDDTEYYSSLTKIGGEEIICLLIPEKVSKIMAYDSHLEEAVQIEFGGDEIRDSKVLWIVTTYEPGSPRKVNLSYEAYKGDRNPVRRMSDYVLRNDELVENWKGYTEKDGFLYSSLSGSLIGTTEMTARPIYEMMRSGEGEGWNRSKRYSIGDTAKIGNTVFKSVEANNIGNHPYYSRKWVKEQ